MSEAGGFQGRKCMNKSWLSTVRDPRDLEQAGLPSLVDLLMVDGIQGLETRLAGLPEFERKRLMDRVIRLRQAEVRRLCDAALRGGVCYTTGGRTP